MLEKQLTGHRVDRSICSWYWDHAVSQGDQVAGLVAFPLALADSIYLSSWLCCSLGI